MSTYRPSPLAALLNGLGGSLPDFTNALVQRKWKSQDSAAAMEEKRREEEAKAAMAALGDARDMSRYSLMDIPATAGQRMEADQVLGGAGYNVDRALDPALHTQTEQTPEGYPFQRTYSPDVVARATRVAETLGKMPKPRTTGSSGRGKETPLTTIINTYLTGKGKASGLAGGLQGYQSPRGSEQWKASTLEAIRAARQAWKREPTADEKKQIGDTFALPAAAGTGVRG